MIDTADSTRIVLRREAVRFLMQGLPKRQAFGLAAHVAHFYARPLDARHA